MTEDDLFQCGLFELAGSLHASISGSGDPLQDDEEAKIVAYLRKRAAEWRPSVIARFESYDLAVLQLVQAVLLEYGNKWRGTR